MKRFVFPMSVEDCIINKTPNLLLDTVDNVTADMVVCRMTVGSRDSVAYTEEKELPVMALLEVMAQTMSVWSTLNQSSRSDRRIRFGILVDISRMIVTRNSHLPRGMSLVITAHLDRQERGYVRFYCEVKDELENEIIATARMTGLVPSDTQIHDFVKHTELNRL